MMVPRCGKSFYNWVSSKYSYTEIYRAIGSPRPYDVTFREGWNRMEREEREMYSNELVSSVLREISEKHYPAQFNFSKYFITTKGETLNKFRNMFPVKDLPQFYAHVNTIRDIDACHNNNFDNITLAYRFYYDEDIHTMYLNKLRDLEYSQFYTTYQDMLSHHISLNNKISHNKLNHLHDINVTFRLDNACYKGSPYESALRFSKYVKNNFENRYYDKISMYSVSDSFGKIHKEELFNILITMSSVMNIKKVCISIHETPNEDETIAFIGKCLDLGVNKFEVADVKTGGPNNLLLGAQCVPNFLTYVTYYKALATYIYNKTKTTHGVIDI